MKETFKLVLYQLVYYLVKCLPAKTPTKHILLVKTDEIGDYMLIRNLLGYFKKSDIYKDYTITLVGNSLFKQVFDAYDTETVDNVIWINKKDFRKNLVYRFRVLRQVRRLGVSVAVNLIYSRSFRVDDLLVAVSGASVRIGMKNEQSAILEAESWITPAGIFTQLIDSGDDAVFDACRNARFVEQLLHLPVLPVSTALVPKEDAPMLPLPDAYFIIFPGSGLKSKKWPAAGFAGVAKHVMDKYALAPVVCGSAADKPDTEKFVRAFGRPVIDLTGQTSLTQLLVILKGSRLLISVDTGSVHLAASVGCPVFALFSGLHYGRFAPYPREIAPHFFPVYPDAIDEMLAGAAQSDFQHIPVDALKDIPPGKLIAAIDKYLPGIINRVL